jgi:nucleotide-binding universal stress UspA family protein
MLGIVASPASTMPRLPIQQRSSAELSIATIGSAMIAAGGHEWPALSRAALHHLGAAAARLSVCCSSGMGRELKNAAGLSAARCEKWVFARFASRFDSYQIPHQSAVIRGDRSQHDAGAPEKGKTMTFKDILVYEPEISSSDKRLKFAISLAAAFEARLTGLYFHASPALPDFVAAQVPREFLEQRYKAILDRAEARQNDFVAATMAAGISAEFRVTDNDAFTVMARAARYADLIVASQPDPDNPGQHDAVIEALLLSAGCPVLMVPYVGEYPALAKRIMLAWNETRESARAAHDAMPLLKRAEDVVVFTVDQGKAASGGSEFAAHLARHGVKATVRHNIADDISAGEAILSAISDHGADLLVMGAYGHARMRELVFGGVTRDIIAAMTCPTLFSH